MTDAARLIACNFCGSCVLKIGEPADPDDGGRITRCRMCRGGRVQDWPMAVTRATHVFDRDGNYKGEIPSRRPETKYG